jgi:3-oxoacyl-[acyl-carrier-protein] synthase III
MRRAGIVGVGFWAPSTVRTNAAWPAEFVSSFHEHREARRASDFTDIESRASAERPFEELFAKHAKPVEGDPFKGARVRRVADWEEPIARGDARAAQAALDDAGVSPSDVSMIFSSAIVQDKLVPSNGPAIQQFLGCNRAVALGVETYCAALPVQMDLAAALVETGRARYVLCVTSHQVNRINDLTLSFSPMFGDAAGAFLIGEVPADRGIIGYESCTDGALRDAVTYAAADGTASSWWRDGVGRVVPGSDDVASAKIIARNLLAFPIEMVRSLCETASVPIDALATLSMIQPFPWFQAAVAEGLGMAPDRVPSTFDTYSHVGGAALAANLLEARRRGQLRDGSLVGMYALGAGVTRCAALLRWHAPAR